MTEEFNLSEKIVTGDLTSYDEKSEYYDDLTVRVEDVKEFIRLLKEEVYQEWENSKRLDPNEINKRINKLAGDKLI